MGLLNPIGPMIVYTSSTCIVPGSNLYFTPFSSFPFDFSIFCLFSVDATRGRGQVRTLADYDGGSSGEVLTRVDEWKLTARCGQQSLIGLEIIV